MFITKKNYEKALAEQKRAITEERENKIVEQEKRWWEENEKYRWREDYSRNLRELEKRVHQLEVKAGLAEAEPVCPVMVTPNY